MPQQAATERDSQRVMIWHGGQPRLVTLHATSSHHWTLRPVWTPLHARTSAQPINPLFSPRARWFRFRAAAFGRGIKGTASQSRLPSIAMDEPSYIFVNAPAPLVNITATLSELNSNSNRYFQVRVNVLAWTLQPW